MSISGQTGEDLACRYYQSLGYQLLDRNYIAPFGKQTGELDLVFQKDREIVFVEVKARSNDKFGGPFEAVNWSKQRKLVNIAKMYMHLHPQFADYNYRIDVAAADIDNVSEPVIILMNAIEDLN